MRLADDQTICTAKCAQVVCNALDEEFVAARMINGEKKAAHLRAASAKMSMNHNGIRIMIRRKKLCKMNEKNVVHSHAPWEQRLDCEELHTLP